MGSKNNTSGKEVERSVGREAKGLKGGSGGGGRAIERKGFEFVRKDQR